MQRTLLSIWLAVLLLAPMPAAEAQVAALQAGPALVLGPAAPPVRQGVTVEGAATLTALAGRGLTNVAALRSSQAVSTVYFVFPPVAEARTLATASLVLLSRTGVYPATASLDLVVVNYAGELQRRLSTAAIDVQTAGTGAWQSLPLTTNASVGPTELLAMRLTLASGPAGDLDVRPAFEIVFAPYQANVYLPITSR